MRKRRESSMRRNAPFSVEDSESKLIFAYRSVSSLLSKSTFAELCRQIQDCSGLVPIEIVTFPLSFLSSLDHATQTLSSLEFSQDSGWLLYYALHTFIHTIIRLQLWALRNPPKQTVSTLQSCLKVSIAYLDRLRTCTKRLEQTEGFAQTVRELEYLRQLFLGSLGGPRNVQDTADRDPRNRTRPFCRFQILSEELVQFIRKELPGPEHWYGRWLAYHKICTSVHSRLGTDFLVDLYGSYASGLCHRKSDLDIVCRAQHSVSDMSTDESVKKLRCLGRPLRDSAFVVQNIFQAKIPILKLRLVSVNMEADISFSVPSSVTAHKLLLAYSLYDERAAHLMLAVKLWAKIRGISDASKGGLGPFGWVLMVIHYLQRTHPAVVPILQRAADFEDPAHALRKWTKRSLGLKQNQVRYNQQSVGELFAGFFEFYAERFSPAECIVTINTRKDVFAEGQQTHLRIRDPIRSWNNVARGVREPSFYQIMNEIKSCHSLVQQNCALSKIVRGSYSETETDSPLKRVKTNKSE